MLINTLLLLLVAQPQQVYTPEDVQFDLQHRPSYVQCIVKAEIGRGITRNGITYPPYDPYMPGAENEVGPVQLHPRGLLNDFYRQGYTNPYDPKDAHDYLQNAASRGLLSHWPTSRGCI